MQTVQTFGVVARAMACSAILAAGCAHKPQRVKVYPVKGKLLVNGEPAPKANVYFHSGQPIKGANPLPFGVVEPDGTYQPSTYSGHDGLPVGEYQVTVVWPRYVTFDGQQIASDDQLQGKFANPQLPVRTVTIIAGENELPVIDLKR